MPRAVVILGAGASADFGVPTLRCVFKDQEAQRYLKSDATLQRDLEQIFWQPRGHTLQVSDQSLTVEEMLTVLRDWEQEESLRERPDLARFHDFRRRLYVLIYHAVFGNKTSGGRHLNPLIETCRAKFDHVTWASFNWDCIFEASYWYSSGPPGLYAGRRNPTLAIRLQDWRDGDPNQEYLKLHGSVNWWMADGQLTYLRFGEGSNLAQRWREYAQGANDRDFPIILEPSAYKYRDETYQFLEPQWRRFFERLCEADCVLVIGYSLPEGDHQARSKIITAFQANLKSKWLVVDPDPQVCSRYRRLFGQRRVTIMEKTLAGFNHDLASNLQQLT